ncbi:MAG: hypothetical protein GX089_16490 [Fibrobacter sp.]|nr:hypothetical protein [Fibrobacter sp.]
MWKLKVFCLSAFLIPFLLCTNPSKPEQTLLFRNWFTGQTTAENKPAFKIQDIDSLALHFRKIAKTGSFSETLTDSASVQYMIGYRTPDTLRQDTLYPLVIYLHGGTGTALNNKGEKAFEMLLPLADSMQLFLASPSANRYSPWWSPSGLFRILQTLRFMTLHYPVNPEKVFLAGVSDGAAGCFAAANTINGPFAGFLAISGYGGILQATGMQIFPGNIMLRPVYNVNAGKDHLYPLRTVNRFLDYLEENGANVIRKEYPDEKHGFDYRMQEMGTIAGFLRTWSRPAFNSVSWHFVPGFPNLPPGIIDWKLKDETGKGFLNGYMVSDTFKINSEGLRYAVLSLPASDKIFIQAGENPVKIEKEEKLNSQLILQTIRSSCFPNPKLERVFKISL